MCPPPPPPPLCLLHLCDTVIWDRSRYPHSAGAAGTCAALSREVGSSRSASTLASTTACGTPPVASCWRWQVPCPSLDSQLPCGAHCDALALPVRSRVAIANEHAAVAGTHVLARDHHVAALGNVATRPAARRRGCGRAAVRALCCALHEAGVRTVGLNVAAENVAAVGMCAPPPPFCPTTNQRPSCLWSTASPETQRCFDAAAASCSVPLSAVCRPTTRYAALGFSTVMAFDECDVVQPPAAAAHAI